MEKKILIAGAGKIGSLIAGMLLMTNDYEVFVIDMQLEGADINRLKQQLPKLQLQVMDVSDHHAMSTFLQQNKFTAVISSLPFFMNIVLAQLAKQFKLHYFDLTEDTHVTNAIYQLASDAQQAFVPQCGLAPGFINIVTESIASSFSDLTTVKMRVGALPQNTENPLSYALTWSTDGLINQYSNPCRVIDEGCLHEVPPLTGLEPVILDGIQYETFNTSGGVGRMVDLYVGKVNHLNYKTIRYPGHCEKMRFIMQDLGLHAYRDLLKEILERTIPKTYQDVVIIYAEVSGMRHNEFIEETYYKKIYPQVICNLEWSAIQVSTASSLCVVMDIILAHPKKYHGFIDQNQIQLTDFMANRFSKYYQ